MVTRALLFLALGSAMGCAGAMLEIAIGLVPGTILLPLSAYIFGGCLILNAEPWGQGPRHWADWPSLALWPIALPAAALWVAVVEILWPALREHRRGFRAWLETIAGNIASSAGRFLP